MQQFTVRQMHPGDILTAIEIADITGLCEWTEAGFRAHLAESGTFSLSLFAPNGEHSGFLVARSVPGQGSGPDAELLNIAVLPEYQGRSLGRWLMDPFIEWCRSLNVEKIWLEVRASNVPAIKFYRKYRFETAAKRRGLYSDPPEDGILMMCKLPKSRKTSNA